MASLRRMSRTRAISAASTVRFFSVAAGRSCTISSGPKLNTERLWREFFADPSQWWDHRSEKYGSDQLRLDFWSYINERNPDFKHKKIQDALWHNGKFKPPWAEAELAAMAPGAAQSSFFSWNSRLSRYVKGKEFRKALELYWQMQNEDMVLDRFTFVPVLNVCASLRSFEDGKKVHQQIIQNGFETDLYVGSSLVNMYAKCWDLRHPWKVFNNLPARDTVAWNAMILGL